MFKLHSPYTMSCHQSVAVEKLIDGLENNKKNQILMGVTGSGKTFTMANVIARMQRPAIIMAHNKTLAAQLYSEMKEFFPENAVEYFVSYYDYYQPEAYIAKTDVFIEKDAQINEQIDLLRHSATRSLLERRDVIVVASVSCIYGLGAPELYLQMTFKIDKNQKINRNTIMEQLIMLHYTRNDTDFTRGTFRVRGEHLDVFPSHYMDRAWRITTFGDTIEKIYEIDPLTYRKTKELDTITVFAKSHYVTPRMTIEQAISSIKEEMKGRTQWFYDNEKFVESQRIEQRVKFDLEMLMETGSCKGIENYSRYLSGKEPGEPPPTLFEYLPKDAILFVDESHVTVPQVGGMYNGDRARKQSLIEHGFRLPSALDNRPLRFEEWDAMRPNTIFVSATPGKNELGFTGGEFIEQVIRPTGLLDPICLIRPVENQVDDLLFECQEVVKKGFRVLVTTLTKRMAEDLTSYLIEINIKAVYLHSDIDTMERVEIINKLRIGEYDVLVGVNLLREGLDIPECALIAILDADKEGFLRSETALIQTIGRVARNSEGMVILYADVMTKSITKAVEETERRRKLQEEHNKEHNITPTTIIKGINNALASSIDSLSSIKGGVRKKNQHYTPKEIENLIQKLMKQMKKAASDLEFEKAAKIRDEISKLESLLPLIF